MSEDNEDVKTSTEEKQEVELIAKTKEIPIDVFTIDDILYGERHFIRNGENYKEVTKEPKSPVLIHKERDYEVKGTDSFIEYVEEYGVATDGIIFYTDSGVKMYFDESARTDKVSVAFRKSMELVALLDGKQEGKSFTQKEFVEVLETYPEVLGEDNELLIANLGNIKITKDTNVESNIEPGKIKFMYEEIRGTQSTTIPDRFKLTMPFLENGELMDIDVKLEVEVPNANNERLQFKLTCPKFTRYTLEAVEKEIAKIKEKLTGWHFIYAEDKEIMQQQKY